MGGSCGNRKIIEVFCDHLKERYLTQIDEASLNALQTESQDIEKNKITKRSELANRIGAVLGRRNTVTAAKSLHYRELLTELTQSKLQDELAKLQVDEFGRWKPMLVTYNQESLENKRLNGHLSSFKEGALW